MSARPPVDPRDAERLSAWFDGELGEVEAAEARTRLLDDPAARALLQEWRGLREDLRELQPEALEPARMERLRQRLAAAATRDARGLERAVRLWSVAAALLLLASAGWLAGIAWQRDAAGGRAYAAEPRAIERAIEDLLAPPAETPPARPQPGGALAERLRSARPLAPDAE